MLPAVRAPGAPPGATVGLPFPRNPEMAFDNDGSFLEQMLKQMKEKEKCKYFNTPNGCDKGARCKMLHVEEAKPDQVKSEEGVRGPDADAQANAVTFGVLLPRDHCTAFPLCSVLSGAASALRQRCPRGRPGARPRRR